MEIMNRNPETVEDANVYFEELGITEKVKAFFATEPIVKLIQAKYQRYLIIVDGALEEAMEDDNLDIVQAASNATTWKEDLFTECVIEATKVEMMEILQVAEELIPVKDAVTELLDNHDPEGKLTELLDIVCEDAIDDLMERLTRVVMLMDQGLDAEEAEHIIKEMEVSGCSIPVGICIVVDGDDDEDDGDCGCGCDCDGDCDDCDDCECPGEENCKCGRCCCEGNDESEGDGNHEEKDSEK